MENTQQSAYIKQRLKQFAVVVLFLSVVLGTWVVFQFFLSLFIFFVECIPGTIMCGLAFCALKQSFTKANFVLIQLAIYPDAVLVAKLLALGVGMVVLGVVSSSGLWYFKKWRQQPREKRVGGLRMGTGGLGVAGVTGGLLRSELEKVEGK